MVFCILVLFGITQSAGKGIAEFFYSFLADRILYMKIVLRHINVSVPDNALNGLQINAQCLHLRHIGMAAVVWSQLFDTINLFDLSLELVSEIGGITGRVRFANFPDIFVGSIPKLDSFRSAPVLYGERR